MKAYDSRGPAAQSSTRRTAFVAKHLSRSAPVRATTYVRRLLAPRGVINNQSLNGTNRWAFRRGFGIG